MKIEKLHYLDRQGELHTSEKAGFKNRTYRFITSAIGSRNYNLAKVTAVAL